MSGLAFVTLVLLPALRAELGDDPHAVLAAIEARFAPQARIAVVLVGLSGAYLLRVSGLWHMLEIPVLVARRDDRLLARLCAAAVRDRAVGRIRACCRFVRAPRWRPQIASGKARVADRGVPRSRLATPQGVICGPTRRDKRCFATIQRCSTLVQNDCAVRTTPRLAAKQCLARTRTKRQQALEDLIFAGRDPTIAWRRFHALHGLLLGLPVIIIIAASTAAGAC